MSNYSEKGVSCSYSYNGTVVFQRFGSMVLFSMNGTKNLANGSTTLVNIPTEYLPAHTFSEDINSFGSSQQFRLFINSTTVSIYTYNGNNANCNIRVWYSLL